MILVLTTYRTGSTYFCKQLAEQNNFKNYDELFHEHLVKFHKDNLRTIEKDPNCVIKVMPWHLQKTPIENLLDKLLSFNPKIYILVRKDFDQQVQSYYICRCHFQNEIARDWHEDFSNQEQIKYDRTQWDWVINFLHNQYLDLSDIRKKLPEHELVFTHQFDQSKKYNRPVIWDRKPGFTNIDIEELFV